MKFYTVKLACLMALASVLAGCATGRDGGLLPPPRQPLELCYAAPADLTNWTSALPIGNGRLGAMVFGGIKRERIQLNEDTLWSGGPYDPVNTNALAVLPLVRQLIFDGKYIDAQRMIGSNMMAVPPRQAVYETVGDLFLNVSNASETADYRRELNLDTAIAGVSYVNDGVKYHREIFSSPVDQVIVVHLTANQPRKINFSAGLQTPQKATVSIENGDTLVMDGMNAASQGIPGALKFQARVRVLAEGGKISTEGDQISVSGANSATLLVAATTSYKNYQDVSGDPAAIVKQQIAAASKISFERLRAASVAEYQRLFRRVDIDLGSSDAMNLPTDERIQHFSEGKDSQLAALYFQFARYLLICSSRPGSQPANLQGIWNGSMNPPWGGKYTININTEMNYWPADSGNLSECVEPLVALVKDLSQAGTNMARVEYGAHGWVAHHNTDLWRATGPIDGPQYGMWPMGGAWLCNQLWDHYQFTGDKKLLADIYPAMRGACEFFLDTLVEDPTNHWLVTCPSLSPENTHAKGAAICAGPTMDLEILRDLFTNTIMAGEILNQDADLRKQLADERARLAPLQIGKEGQLQEWLDDWDMEAKDLHHRHVSHCYGLFPSGQIDVRTTPEIAAAVKKSLEIRGDKATGWATAWRINLWARLHEGDHVWEIFKFLLSPERTYPDMFDAHPPFQIDGNFGGTSGLIEMLLQSQNGVIELLPALPHELANGSVRGLCARGSFTVDMMWKDGKLTGATIHSLLGNPCRIRYGDIVRDFNLKAGASLKLDGSLN